MSNTIKVKFHNWFNYGTFNSGKLVKTGETQDCDYWRGSNKLFLGRKYAYFTIISSRNFNGTRVFAEEVFRFPKNNEKLLQKITDNLDRLYCEYVDPNDNEAVIAIIANGE